MWEVFNNGSVRSVVDFSRHIVEELYKPFPMSAVDAFRPFLGCDYQTIIRLSPTIFRLIHNERWFAKSVYASQIDLVFDRDESQKVDEITGPLQTKLRDQLPLLAA